jgi:hypothetical protein
MWMASPSSGPFCSYASYLRARSAQRLLPTRTPQATPPTHRFSRNVFALRWFFPMADAFQVQ